MRSGFFGHSFNHGQRLLGSCVATRADPQTPGTEELRHVGAASAAGDSARDFEQLESGGNALVLSDAEAVCSSDLARPFRCPAPGAKVFCVASYIDCLRWLHSDDAPQQGCEFEATGDKATRRWACP